MFCKRNDGLGRVFLPFIIAGLVLASVSLWAAGVRGWAAAAVWLGLYAVWSVGLLLVYFLAIYLLSLTVDMTKPVPDDHPAYRRIVVYVIGILCRFGRVRLDVRGMERLPEGRFLLVSNHMSNYDPIVTVWALRRRDMAFVTKPENLRIPLAGPMIYKANYLPIDRENPRRALETINQAASLLKRDVVSVGVYPEGTRNRDGLLLPFHNAVFKIAKRADVPIVVVAVSGTEYISKNLPWRRTDVTLTLRDVLGRDEVAQSSTAEIGERVRALLQPTQPARAEETVTV